MGSRSIQKDSGDEILSEINVIPLVDISLVLLIIFMVTANYIIPSSFVVDLPKAAHAQEPQNNDMASIVVTREGPVYLENVLVTTNELKSRIMERYRMDPKIAVTLAVDKNAYFKDAINILDLLGEIGISRLNIAVTKN